MDTQELDKQLDKVKIEVFKDTKNSAFLISLLCSLQFIWDEKNPDKVGTDGVTLWWGPIDFLQICRSFEERVLTLIHELWHKARLHALRRLGRDPVLWNIACDYRINNDLRAMGYRIPNDWLVKPELDADKILSEEEIYNLLVQQAIPIPAGAKADLREPDPNQTNPTTQIGDVVRAVQMAQLSHQAGNVPGQVKQILDIFLEPKIPWTSTLDQFFTDLGEEDYMWKKPNRNYLDQGIYMPSLDQDETRLQHILFVEDVSGSITENQSIRFNSEIKHIWDKFKPKKLTVIQFDTQITAEKVFVEGDNFDRIEITGRGGTDLEPVRQWIEKHKPTAAVIFSDLYCVPMDPLDHRLPVIWISINNASATVPFGKLIHIRED